MCNPHYTKDTWRKERGQAVLKKLPTVGIGIDDNAAFVIQGDKYTVVSSQPEAWTYRTFWRNSQYIEERLPESGSLADVFTR